MAVSVNCQLAFHSSRCGEASLTPYFLWIYSKPLSSPGTPLASPPTMLPIVKLAYISSYAALGAVSRKSTSSYSPVSLRTSIKPPPPMPLWYIPITPTHNVVPTMASAALPLKKISMTLSASSKVRTYTAPYEIYPNTTTYRALTRHRPSCIIPG